MSDNQPTAMALLNTRAMTASGIPTAEPIKTGERFYGHWMQDGRFYYPMTQKDGSVVICAGGKYEFGPIIED